MYTLFVASVEALGRTNLRLTGNRLSFADVVKLLAAALVPLFHVVAFNVLECVTQISAGLSPVCAKSGIEETAVDSDRSVKPCHVRGVCMVSRNSDLYDRV